jgi:hypothetical protein
MILGYYGIREKNVSAIPDFDVCSVRSYRQGTWNPRSVIYEATVLLSFSSIDVFYFRLFELLGTYVFAPRIVI